MTKNIYSTVTMKIFRETFWTHDVNGYHILYNEPLHIINNNQFIKNLFLNLTRSSGHYLTFLLTPVEGWWAFPLEELLIDL